MENSKLNTVKKENMESMEKEKPKKRSKPGKLERQRRRRKKAAAAKATEAAEAWIEADLAARAAAGKGAVRAAEQPEIWKNTFLILRDWHREQVMSFWGVRIEYETEEDDETSSQEGEYEVNEVNPHEEQDEEEVDAEYLRFLAVTRKHQKEVRAMRA